MRTLLLALIAAALGVSSAFLVACGDRNDLIPRSDASAMDSGLSRASDLYAQQECRAAQAEVIKAQDRASSLPSQVSAALRRNLDQNLQHVLQRIQVDCGKTRSTQSTQTTTPSTQSTQTTQTTTQPPTTTTSPPTTTTAPPTTTTAPPPTTTGSSGGTPAGRGGSGGSG